MTARAEPPSCPFCGFPVGARVRVCRHCRAERRSAPGMTPRHFRRFVLLWGLLAVSLMAFALYLAALPWSRTGTPPGYALSLVGAHEARPQARCHVIVFDSNGQRSEQLADGPCGPVATGAAAGVEENASGPPSQTTQRLASALHSTIALAGGALGCWLLLPLLRLLFRRRGEVTWVRRVAQGHP